MRLAAATAALWAALWASGARAGVASQEDTDWQNFKPVLLAELQAKEIERQTAAVQRLGAFDRAESAQAAFALLSSKDERIADAAQGVVASFRSDGACEWLAKVFPTPQAEKVRMRLVRAFGGMSHPKIEEVLLKCLEAFKEREKLVPTIEALGAMRSKAAAPKLLKYLAAENPFPLRLVATRALARIPTAEQIGPLVDCLQTAQGRMKQETWIALKTLTGESLGADGKLWRDWWEKSKAGFKLDEAGVLSRNLVNSDLGERADVDYYGLPIHAKRVVFVLDQSGSMNLGRPYRRIERVKEELCRLIQGLAPDVRFNVIFFSSRIVVWKPFALEPATPDWKAQAIKFVKSATADGATDTPKAMADALDIAEKEEVETIFLLTDGAPFVGGKLLDFDEVRRGITRANEALKVRINTIGVFYGADEKQAQQAGEPPKAALSGFLRALASENDGALVELQ
jgi:hypothetical protein